jgi:hypothetical protein
MIVCQHCGGLVHGDHDQVAAWLQECRERCFPVRSNRVDERTAAELLGMSQRKLAEMRKHGAGPMVSALPVAGSRYSYELTALARFKSAHQTGEDWD